MALYAASLGTTALAAYQVKIGVPVELQKDLQSWRVLKRLKLKHSWNHWNQDTIDMIKIYHEHKEIQSLTLLWFKLAWVLVEILRACEVLINLYTLFGLFGEPLSQAAQAMLPPLLERKDRRGVRRAMRSLMERWPWEEFLNRNWIPHQVHKKLDEYGDLQIKTAAEKIRL